MALVAGFRAHKSETDESERRGQDTGITRYRRELAARNRLLVFIDEHFAILRSYEFALLIGVTVREREATGESVETVLRRHPAAARDHTTPGRLRAPDSSGDPTESGHRVPTPNFSTPNPR